MPWNLDTLEIRSMKPLIIFMLQKAWDSTPATLLHGKSNIIVAASWFLPQQIMIYIIPSLKFSLTFG